MGVEERQDQDVFGLVGQVLERRFEVIRVVAEGGFGVVYHGHQLALDRPVALKALKLEDHPGRMSTFREVFAAEAKTMARLRHPNIADVYDSGITQLPSGIALPWIALEWLDGLTLEAILNQSRGQGGRGPRATLALLRPALEAIAHAHRQGVAHRDIKPGNMMQTQELGSATLRVLDFGISKIMLPEETAGSGRTRTVGGYCFSPGYASPEQISGGRTGPWTDVHALGLVLTELLTDRAPVEDAQTEIELYAKLLSDTRPTPASKGKNVGPWERVLARALALQPSSRWKDAGQLLDALTTTVDEAETAVRIDVSGRGAATVVRSSQLPGRAAAPFDLATGPQTPGNEGVPHARRGPEAASPRAAARASRGPWLLIGAAVLALGVAAAIWVGRAGQRPPVVTGPVAQPSAPAPPPVSAPAAPAAAPAPSERPEIPAPPAAPAAGKNQLRAAARSPGPSPAKTGHRAARERATPGSKPASQIVDPSNMDIR